MLAIVSLPANTTDISHHAKEFIKAGTATNVFTLGPGAPGKPGGPADPMGP